MKENVDTSKVEEVKKYIEDITGTNITLSSGQKVTILKGAVKEKKDEAILIYRYEVVRDNFITL